MFDVSGIYHYSPGATKLIIFIDFSEKNRFETNKISLKQKFSI